MIGSGKRRGWRETAATVRTGRWGTDADAISGFGSAIAVRRGAYPACVIVLGIDPGTASTGFGVISFDGRDSLRPRAGHRQHRRRAPAARSSGSPRSRRRLGVDRPPRPVAVALESLFIGPGPRTIMSVCQARGATLAVCGAHGLDLHGIRPYAGQKTCLAASAEPTRIRSCASSAAALAARAAPESDHAADALALALCHAWSARAGERFARARRHDDREPDRPSWPGRRRRPDRRGGRRRLHVHASAAAARAARKPQAARLQHAPRRARGRPDALRLPSQREQRARAPLCDRPRAMARRAPDCRRGCRRRNHGCSP